MTQPVPEPVLELAKVTKRFGEHVVYKDMDLQIAEGETITIIGGSGEGKSVCLKLMIGLLTPEDGQVRFRGQNVPDLDEAGLVEVRKKVAYLFQGGALFDSMNVFDNIAYGLREHTKLDDAKIRERAKECLELVALRAEDMDRMPANLSGGERKRVALARSIAIRPEVILYDEPTTGLDPKNITNIGNLIIALQRELKVTSVVVTHDMPMAYKVSDRIAMLYDKRFPFVDTAEVMWHSKHEEVRDFIHGRIKRQHGAA